MNAPRFQCKPIKVSHTTLERSGESPFRSKCPVCLTGYLLVRRDQQTYALLRKDTCISCGQHFVYTDDAIAGVDLK